jgi:hypothetical protein
VRFKHVTTNLILFSETGVLDRELNLASIPYMGSPEGLRHFSGYTSAKHPRSETRATAEAPDSKESRVGARAGASRGNLDEDLRRGR